MELLLTDFPPEAIEALLNGAFDGVAIAENGRMLYVNQGLASIFGYSVQELIGMNTFDLAAPESFEPVKESTLSGKARDYRASGVRRDGQVFTAHLRSIPFQWNGRLLRLTAIRDATSLKAEEKLEETSEMFEATFEQAAVGITHTSPGGTQLRVNRRFGELLGYEPSELIGRECKELLHPEDLPASMELLGKVLSGELPSFSREVRYLHKKGSLLWCQVTLSPVFSTTGKIKYLILIIQDISGRKHAEEKLLEHRLRMFASSKMSALGEMAGGIAHEINNPLAIIRSYVGVLRESIQSNFNSKKDLLSSVEKIDATAVRITQIVRSLSGFARDSDSDPFQIVQVRDIVSDTLNFCETRLKQNQIEVIWDEIPELLAIECRMVPISQVVLNLLSNAVDALSGREQRRVWIQARDLGVEVEISVEDSGPGVSPDIRDRIMQPFFTTKRGGQGTGLGLSISKKIVESHLGSLTLDAASARTRFVLRLPKRHAGA